jgi:hypothetical protein
VSAVTPTEISRLLNTVTARVSTATADAVYRTGSALFNAAVADDVIAKSPVRPSATAPSGSARPTSCSSVEARQLLLHLTGWQRDTALLQVALGARIGEIAGSPPTTSTCAAGGSRSGDATTAARCVPPRTTGCAPSSCHHHPPTLERLIDTAGDVPPIPPLDDREHDASHSITLADPDLDRSPGGRLGLQQGAEVACDAVGVPRISSHSLRHAYVSWMIDEGHSADKVAFWIGDTPETVRSVYAHMLEASSAPAAASIDAALSMQAAGCRREGRLPDEVGHTWSLREWNQPRC